MENNTPANNQTPQQDVQSNSGIKGLLANRKIVLVILTALLLVIVGIIGFLVLRRGSSDQVKLPPEVEIPENVLLASVGEKQIWRDDVVKLALEQVLAPAIDSEVMKTFLNIAVELAILEQEAQIRNIEIPELPTEKEKYEYLKLEVVKGEVKSVTAYTIDYWIPADGYPQEPIFEEQRSITPQVIEDAELMLSNGDDPLVVANVIYDKYPVLQSVLAFNGGLMKQARDKGIDLVSSPRVYEYVESEGVFHLQDALFAMSDGDIEGYIWPDKSGAAIIKVQSATRGENINYDTWIANKKQAVVYNQENVNNLK